MCSSPKIVDPKEAMVIFYANRNSMTSMVTTRLTNRVRRCFANSRVPEQENYQVPTDREFP